ncbi:MAG: Na+/H+ antiporter NhaC family protein [Oscillospiraceae bacterium]|nr:Na+/H+ antiporter NhaC family protein [Oscillospiraceae bacterium]
MEQKKASKPQTNQSPLISILKFTPLFLFAGLVLFLKFDLLLAAPIASFAAIVIYMFSSKISFSDAFEQGMMATKNIVLIFFILMFAYAVAESFMVTGVGASMINLALKLGVTGRSVAAISLIVTCMLSVATGSSWGTFAACAPIFLWLSHILGGNPALTVCAIAGGSCFGDNIGMISDVTVLSCGMQNIKIIDRVRHQLFWSVGCLLIALGVFYLSSLDLPTTPGDPSKIFETIPSEVMENLAQKRPSAVQLLNQVRDGVPLYMIVPVVVVIGMSFLNFHTLLCLGAGVLSSLLLGTLAGTVSFAQWFSSEDNGPIFTGFSSAGSWVVVMMMWVSVFGGIMNAMDAFAPLKRLVVRMSRNLHHLMGWCSVLCLVGNAALADEAAQVATMSPIIRDIVEKNTECDSEADAYDLRVKLATFTSSMGIYGSELIPWHCFPVFFASIATVVYPLKNFSPADIISRNYTSFIMIGSILILTFTGWDRFLPKFGLPKGACLKKQD